jgi:F0F1-type ATP synthase assembly protein I
MNTTSVTADTNPANTYHLLLEQYIDQAARCRKKKTVLGSLRLLVFILAALLIWFTFKHSALAGWLSVIAGVVAFIFLVFKDADNTASLERALRLAGINKAELEILDGNFLEAG